jgi:hypothetical protein
MYAKPFEHMPMGSFTDRGKESGNIITHHTNQKTINVQAYRRVACFKTPIITIVDRYREEIIVVRSSTSFITKLSHRIHKSQSFKGYDYITWK